jgi:glycosyltransferase involved in cell wall biosynthesis
MKTVSIIIPTYQHAPDIAACLKSIFGQTFRDFEVIVVDDGSTDNTQDVLKPYLDRITLITQPNSGGNVARNNGFKHSQGKFVLFCDADIILDAQYLEKMLSTLEQNPDASYAYSAFKFGWKTFKFWDFDGDTLKKLNYISTMSLIRREHFPLFDENIRKFQDWDLWLTMLEQGHKGVYIPEVLFQAIPHKEGISFWIPRFFHKVPWKKLGWKMMSVQKYKSAETIIREKHHIPDTSKKDSEPWRWFWQAFAAITTFEIISLIGFIQPKFGAVAFVLCLALTAFTAYKNYSLAVLILLSDLFIGSQGGAMLSLPINDSIVISWRIGLFAVIGIAYTIKLITSLYKKQGSATEAFIKLHEHHLLIPYVALFASFVFAIVRGLSLQNGKSEVFLDANGYFYFALLIPILTAFLEDREFNQKIRALLTASLATTAIKTLLVLYFFSHRFQPIMLRLYSWIRDTRVGEITRMGETDFYRVFFQSHVFTAIFGLGVVLWMALIATRKDGGLRRTYTLLALMMATIVLGLSRSFWVGIFCALIVLVGILIWKKVPASAWRRIITYGLSSAFIGTCLVATAFALPFHKPTGEFSLAYLLGSRASSFTGEAAAQSRWTLLPKLIEAGKEYPILGSGFGRSVTYETSDPRIFDLYGTYNYTTTAFEWGYLDIWIKLGLLGLLIYAWFIIKIYAPYLRDLAKSTTLTTESSVTSLTILLAGIALLGTSIFSPYLNHPLGIGVLMLTASFAIAKQTKN